MLDSIAPRAYRSPVTLPEYRRGVTPPNAGKKYPAETLTRHEVHRLLAVCGRGPAGKRMRALIIVLWRSGLRISEALALYPKDIDLERGTITVLHGKGDRRRVVGLDPQAGAVLDDWLQFRRRLGFTGRQAVFCTFSGPAAGKPIYSAYVRDRLKELGERAAIEKRVHPHGLRHTHAAELMREGQPVTIIRRQLGHSSLAVTARYVDHLDPTEVIAAMQGRTWAHD